MKAIQQDIPNAAISIEALMDLWKLLEDIPTDANDCLEEPFQDFPAGTHREVVWHWFEAQNPLFIVGKVMDGSDLTKDVSQGLPTSKQDDATA